MTRRQAEALEEVQRFHAELEATERARLGAIRIAIEDAGCSYADVARVLGMTRQGVRAMVGRCRAPAS